MATALQEKGYRIAGAAKIVAVHSLMWSSTHPEGEGRPDADDLQQVRRWTAELVGRLEKGTLVPLAPEELDYHSPDLAAELKAKIGRPWANIPRTVDPDACTECGDCAEVCPVGTITLSPLPEFGDSCFDCFNCIRLCPENALTPAVPLVTIESFIRQRVATIDEQPVTQLFLTET
jgi:ferredoxin